MFVVAVATPECSQFMMPQFWLPASQAIELDSCRQTFRVRRSALHPRVLKTRPHASLADTQAEGGRWSAPHVALHDGETSSDLVQVQPVAQEISRLSLYIPELSLAHP